MSKLTTTGLIPFSIGNGYWVHGRDRPDRFINFFRAAAAALPTPVADVLELFWSSFGANSPLLRIITGDVLLTNSGRMVGIGMTDFEGCHLSFAAGAVQQIPNDLGRDLVVHEMAHAFTFAELKFNIIGANERKQLQDVASDIDRLQKLMEQFADQSMRTWSIDPCPLRVWSGNYLKRLER